MMKCDHCQQEIVKEEDCMLGFIYFTKITPDKLRLVSNRSIGDPKKFHMKCFFAGISSYGASIIL
jgi:hypothetical protein